MKIAKTKLHALPSSMRIKKRYILVEFFSEQSFSLNELNQALQASALSLFGSSFTAQLALHLVDFNLAKKRAIVKCSRIELERAKTVILFLTQAGLTKVIPKIVKVSGSIKKLKT
ncbi:MAG: Rpp14/Pop5 family protein [Candidatus Diapherotrites archaeon]|nr:Rpp14/Pop5 family protein [Candidatus Diapherotrites archaeon]